MAKNPKKPEDAQERIKLFPPHRKWVDMNAYTFAKIVLEAQKHGQLDGLMSILERDHVTVKAETVNATKTLFHDNNVDTKSPFARTILRLDPSRCKKRPTSPKIG
ncbi:MAG: hypothetical protein EOS54_23055 [Mesorhizobium sp.]|uniref:hypothetical protein n=1 Tax=Mesorhizobium sp. TaxID=1871066 RepID=UPI000FE89A97|nr:hypothetical protein [Mesorhizobium sp.]RWC48597.1 MAG: hypothetical protein EOS54_23055 [Mesorhizobium sp.]